MVINFRTRMTTSYAELGETCVATTAQLGIVVFFCCAYATATFRTTHSDPCGAALWPVDTVMPISILWCSNFMGCDLGEMPLCRSPRKKILYHSAGVVDTRHFAKIRVSQGDLRSKLNRHARPTSLSVRFVHSLSEYVIIRSLSTWCTFRQRRKHVSQARIP